MAVRGTGAPDVHFPGLRPLSLTRSGSAGRDGGGGRWQTQEAACRGQAATAWRVTQVNKLDHKEEGNISQLQRDDVQQHHLQVLLHLFTLMII